MYNLCGKEYVKNKNYEISKKCNLQCDVCIMRLEMYRKVVKYDHLILTVRKPFQNYKEG